jgi:hypothetical protein
LDFPSAYTKEDGAYRTVFGPVANHDGVTLARCDENMVGGLTRLTGIRCPERVAADGATYHDWLCAQQCRFANEDAWFQTITDEIRMKVTSYFDATLDDVEVNQELNAMDPRHPKYKIRFPAWFDEIQGGTKTTHRTWVIRNGGYIKVVGKGRETAKSGKFIRATCDLGTPASLAGGDLIEKIKYVIADMGIVYGTQFIKSPDLDSLASTFEELLSPTEQLYFPYFSDDSCVAIRCADGIFRANVDISTCDASHTKEVFKALRRMASGNWRLLAVVNKCIAQCESDFVTRSYANPKNNVKFSVDEPILFSGSLLTTLINNIANLMIASSIKTRLTAQLLMSECEDLIATASASAGYIVTCFVCKNVQQLQFLKHSPCWSNSGKLVPVLNLGVICRTIGVCWGDLPMYANDFTWSERADEYNRRQTSCYKRGARHSLLDALIDRYNPRDEVGQSSVNEIPGDHSFEHVSDEQIAMRYSVSAADIAELARAYASGSDSIQTRASKAIMMLDYGLAEATSYHYEVK